MVTAPDEVAVTHFSCSVSCIFPQTAHEGELASRQWTVKKCCWAISIRSFLPAASAAGAWPVLRRRQPAAGGSWLCHGSLLSKHHSNIPDHQGWEMIRPQWYPLRQTFSMLPHLHLIMTGLYFPILPSVQVGIAALPLVSQWLYRCPGTGFSHPSYCHCSNTYFPRALRHIG